MTNEELTMHAKKGDRKALAQLWEQNKGLLAVLFRELTRKAGARMTTAGITWEDVEQCFYLTIVHAVALYDAKRGMLFSSFLSFSVKSVFYELIGWRTEKQKRDPLGQCVSLDEPISTADGDGLRGDLIPDRAAEQPFEDAEERIYSEQLHNALEECLSTLDQPQADAVRCRYYERLTHQQTAERLGCNAARARKLEGQGLRKLRSPQNTQQLAQFKDQIISTHAYHGTGFHAWKYGGSVEERIVERLERIERAVN